MLIPPNAVPVNLIAALRFIQLVLVQVNTSVAAVAVVTVVVYVESIYASISATM